jgi:hypothetical protein
MHDFINIHDEKFDVIFVEEDGTERGAWTVGARNGNRLDILAKRHSPGSCDAIESTDRDYASCMSHM